MVHFCADVAPNAFVGKIRRRHRSIPLQVLLRCCKGPPIVSPHSAAPGTGRTLGFGSQATTWTVRCWDGELGSS